MGGGIEVDVRGDWDKGSIDCGVRSGRDGSRIGGGWVRDHGCGSGSGGGSGRGRCRLRSTSSAAFLGRGRLG